MIKKLDKDYLVFSKFYPQIPANILFYEDFFSFPFIIKPDFGERGKDVHLVRDSKQWEGIFKNLNGAFILQEYIPSEIELGVLYYRFPSGKSNISSVVIKEFLKVKGDGKLTLQKLVENNFRAKKRLDYFQEKFNPLWLSVVPKDEEIVLEEIGNHCRGTVFRDGNHLINQKLVKVFDKIVSNEDNFNYGRFDLKANSIEEMYQGKGIAVFELNGVNSEPAHIYEPRKSLLKAYKDVFFHYQIVFKISQELKAKGIKPKEKITEFLKALKLHFIQAEL